MGSELLTYSTLPEGSRCLITIVTASYNPGPAIHATYESIASQKYQDFQWLVADGGSKDGTVSWLSGSRYPQLCWFSGEDEGIYDAWNKAVPLVRGDWILFLGCGDLLPDNSTLGTVAKYLEEVSAEVELVYGEVLMVDPSTRQVIERISSDWSALQGKWRWRAPATPPNSGVFYRAEMFRRGERFDSRFKIVGDSHFMAKSILRRRPKFIRVLVSIMPIDGISNDWTRALEIAGEYSLIARDLHLEPPFVHRMMDWIKVVVKIAANHFLPRRIAEGFLNLALRAMGRPERW